MQPSGFEYSDVVDVTCNCSWSLTYGPWILGALAGVTGAIFNGHFRQRMVLRNRARLATFIPSFVIPFAATSIAQQSIVYDRLLETKSQCLFCSEISAMSAQVRMSCCVKFIFAKHSTGRYILPSECLFQFSSLQPMIAPVDLGYLLRCFRYQLSEMYGFAQLGHLKQPRSPARATDEQSSLNSLVICGSDVLWFLEVTERASIM